MGAPQSRRDGSAKLADQAVARPSWRKLRSGLERGDARGDRTSQGFEAPGAKQGRLFLVEAGPVALGFQQVPRTHWAVKGRQEDWGPGKAATQVGEEFGVRFAGAGSPYRVANPVNADRHRVGGRRGIVGEFGEASEPPARALGEGSGVPGGDGVSTRIRSIAFGLVSGEFRCPCLG